MICAVALRKLRPGAIFLLERAPGDILVGALERVASGGGYATVEYMDPGRVRHHEFRDDKEQWHEFQSSGLRREEWSAGTLVRPLAEEDEDGMSDNPLVEDASSGSATVSNIKDKVAKMKDRAATKGASGGNGKAASAKKPMSAETKAKLRSASKAEKNNDCRCGCGSKTGGTFATGHDARYYGWLKKVIAGSMEFKELPRHLQKEFVDVKGVKKSFAASGHK